MTYARGEIGSAEGEVSELTPDQMADFKKANIIKKVCCRMHNFHYFTLITMHIGRVLLPIPLVLITKSNFKFILI